MKKIFKLFVIITYLIIIFFQNIIMSFAMNNLAKNKTNIEIKVKKINCCKEKKSNPCKKNCCIKNIIEKNINPSNINLKEKILKIKIFSFIDIFSISKYFIENKNLIKNSSPPPNLEKKIKYYSYRDLVKIIKSNT